MPTQHSNGFADEKFCSLQIWQEINYRYYKALKPDKIFFRDV